MKRLFTLLDTRLLFYLVFFLVLFVPLYPKLPAIGVRNTWVYIRLEDFVIAFAGIIFFIQLIRKKVTVPIALGIPIVIYWAIGLLSLILSMLIIGPQLMNYFPHVAILSYLRRVEYMVLFFIGFAAVRKERDLKKIFWGLTAACIVLIVYGLGQRFYINIWAAFPAFFEKFAFCFPSFQTTNEEFAKGIPLCLPPDGRITSLFGGHYDLSAYLVLVIPVIFAVSFSMKKNIQKITLWTVGSFLIYILILTASRISFVGYLIGIVCAFMSIKRKMALVPLLLLSLFLLFASSSSVLERFSQTFRFTNLAVNSKGDVVGEVVSQLPVGLRDKISKEPVEVDTSETIQKLPTGSSYINLPGQGVATTSAFLTTNNNSKNQKDRYKFGTVEISSVTGNFLVKRALVYDISFTTRFQGEWPYAWAAFMRYPFFGQGYSTITLATDNSYLRALGEVGAYGFIAFFSFFLVWGIYIKKNVQDAPLFVRNMCLGLSAGLIGLAINALLIDVFEASKVAESMWLLLGVSAGALALSATEKIRYPQEIKKILTSNIFLMIYLLILFFVFLAPSFNNYFVGDDFSWLRWAATSNKITLLSNFIDAQGFFFRPIPKLFIFIEYTFFSLQQAPYHIINLFFNYGVSVAVYFLLFIIWKKKLPAFFGAILFSFIPSHSQDLYWMAAISPTISTVFVLFGLLAFYGARVRDSALYYVLSFALFILAVFSYENAVIFIGLMVLVDIFLVEKKYLRMTSSRFFPYVVSVLIIGVYLILRLQAHAAGFSGDYNYNLSKILPNSIGNFLGYIFLFFMGENSLFFYSLLRADLRAYAIPLSIVGCLLIAFVGGFFLEHKERIRLSAKAKLFIFGLLFSIVSLLPYLPLGNIALRYVYLPSFGFVVMILVLVDGLLGKIKKKQYNLYAYIILTGMVGILCFAGLQKAQSYWGQASLISFDTLARLKLDYDFKKNTNLYFYNIPTKIGEAYVFPVGLPDAIYFINSDPSLKIFIVGSKDTATQLRNGAIGTGAHTFIFTFDKENVLREVKNNE